VGLTILPQPIKIRGNLLYPRYLRRISTSDAAILTFEVGKVHNSL